MTACGVEHFGFRFVLKPKRATSPALQMRIDERRERRRMHGREIVPAARHDMQLRIGQPFEQPPAGRDGLIGSSSPHSSVGCAMRPISRDRSARNVRNQSGAAGSLPAKPVRQSCAPKPRPSSRRT